mmetsp:Transcript_70316/g.189286  ORF Transcript_70316/g.189286 Transcript_70316/m.189286 type:complete len:232 (+) Transcript_70316:567-1262(+)
MVDGHPRPDADHSDAGSRSHGTELSHALRPRPHRKNPRAMHAEHGYQQATRAAMDVVGCKDHEGRHHLDLLHEGPLRMLVLRGQHRALPQDDRQSLHSGAEPPADLDLRRRRLALGNFQHQLVQRQVDLVAVHEDRETLHPLEILVAGVPSLRDLRHFVRFPLLVLSVQLEHVGPRRLLCTRCLRILVKQRVFDPSGDVQRGLVVDLQAQRAQPVAAPGLPNQRAPDKEAG